MTKSAIDGFAVAERDTVYWDQGLPGFGVKVTPRGRKVFIVMYRLGGAGSRLRKYTIGPYGRIADGACPGAEDLRRQAGWAGPS